jgi:hypothetical protein
VRVYTVPEGTINYRFAAGADQRWLLAPDGTRVAAVTELSPGRPGVRVIDVRSGQELGRRDASVQPVLAWSPQGNVLLFGIGNEKLELWDLAADTSVAFAHGHQTLTAVAMTVKGDRVVTAGTTKGGSVAELKVREIVGLREVASSEAGPGHIEALAVSPDGMVLLTESVEQRQTGGGGCGSPTDLFGGLGDNGTPRERLQRIASNPLGLAIVIGVVALGGLLLAFLVYRWWGRRTRAA